MVDKAVRDLTRMETDDDLQWKRTVEWARRNPEKTVEVYALNMDERDRIRARLSHFNGDTGAPTNIYVTVRPDDYATPVHVRI